MKKRILSIFLAAVIAAGCIPTKALAASPTHVLALGDSITTGYGLSDAKTERFTSLLGNDTVITNRAVNGNTAAGIISQLQKGNISATDIASADFITITTGGNDIMQLLYSQMAEMHHAAYHSNMKANDVRKIMNELNQSNLLQHHALLKIAEQLLSKDNPAYLMHSQAFTEMLNTYQQDLTEITTALKAVNPDARIIVATLYNPYAECRNHSLLHPFYQGIEEGVNRLNTVIAENTATGGYAVADVKTAFTKQHSAKNDLYNADTKWNTFNLDFHPTAKGHKVLAEVFKASIKENRPANSITFTDISSDAYYTGAVKWAVSEGITAGTSENTFSPDAVCTRAQVVTFLWRAAGSPVPKSTDMTFCDVPADSYCRNAVLWAVENGITAGTSENTFSPDAHCTRGQIVTFLWRSQKSPSVSTGRTFQDVAADSYCHNAILWATEENITAGTSENTFSPDAHCTRGQIVTFLWRFLN